MSIVLFSGMICNEEKHVFAPAVSCKMMPDPRHDCSKQKQRQDMLQLARDTSANIIFC
jgi:hypothetical protein